jgi:hypothetical protein
VPELRVSANKATIMGAGGEPEETIHMGDILSIHGQTGEVFVGSRQVLGIEKEE